MLRTDIEDFVEDYGVECPAGLSLYSLNKFTRELLIDNYIYNKKLDRLKAIHYLEKYVFSPEGDILGVK